MILSFGDDTTADLYHGKATHHVRRFPPDLKQPALRKLDMLDAADAINDLREPPGNHLEALKGNLAGYHSIRINEQWRLVFRWKGNNAYEVSLMDYH